MLMFFKSELKRAIISKNMAISIFICIVSFLFIIIATMPFATSYLEDCSSGYYLSIKDKIGGFKYVITKFVVNFIAGGLVIFIPFILFFLSDYNLNLQMIFNLDTDINLSMTYRLIYALFVVLVSISVFMIKYILDEKNNKEIAFKSK